MAKKELENSNIVSMTHPGYLNNLNLQKEVMTMGSPSQHVIAGYEDINTGDYVFVGNAADILYAADKSSAARMLNATDIQKDSIYRIPMREKEGKRLFDSLSPKLTRQGYRIGVIGSERVKEILSMPVSQQIKGGRQEKMENPSLFTSAVQLDLFSGMRVEQKPQRERKEEQEGFDPTKISLRKLEEGEHCYVERRYTEAGYFSFTGTDHIESDSDVAYIFRALEDKSVENSFICMVKDGKPTVFHLGIGSATEVMAPIENTLPAFQELQPEKVWFIHNHPSGNLKVSKDDFNLQKRMEEVFGEACQPGIIINTTSGKFMTYNSQYEYGGDFRVREGKHGKKNVKTYAFDKTVFSKDWNPETAFKALSYYSVAGFVSSHRLGEHEKLNLIIVDNHFAVTGNVFLPWTDIAQVCDKEHTDAIARTVLQIGGKGCYIYGSDDAIRNKEVKAMNILQDRLKQFGVKLVDVMSVKRSLYDEGVIKNQKSERSIAHDDSVRPRRLTPQQRETGGALVDQLQRMGIKVHTDLKENRRALKEAQKDQSQTGKIRYMKSPTGENYGWVYKGEMRLDLRKLDGELALHEYAHLWCEAMRRVNPQNWAAVVNTVSKEPDTMAFVKRQNPHISNVDDLVEEAIASYSGKKGAERLQEELQRMTPRDSNYNSRWNNIFQNISKAIQDFWQHVGDSMNIRYQSKDDIADMILKDFAEKVNPVAKVGKWLESRDKIYEESVENDIDMAVSIFEEALQENIGNGITPFVAAGGYRGEMQSLAHRLKDENDTEAVNLAAEKIVPVLPDVYAALVPAPGHEGYATHTLRLANKISELTGLPVVDALRGEPRESQYDHKKATGKPLNAEELRIFKVADIPHPYMPIVIDNVVHTGNTAEACVKALGGGIVVSLASAVSQERHVASLKSASPIVYDKEGKLIPLSERFELKNGYIGKIKQSQEPVEEKEITGLKGYSEQDVLKYVREHFESMLEGTGIDAEIVDMKVIGSRVNGNSDSHSDLDVLLEFKGDASEDSLFNILNNEEEGRLYIEGIPVDINPITEGKSGTIQEFLERNAGYSKETDKTIKTYNNMKNQEKIEQKRHGADATENGQHLFVGFPKDVHILRNDLEAALIKFADEQGDKTIPIVSRVWNGKYDSWADVQKVAALVVEDVLRAVGKGDKNLENSTTTQYVSPAAEKYGTEIMESVKAGIAAARQQSNMENTTGNMDQLKKWIREAQLTNNESVDIKRTKIEVNGSESPSTVRGIAFTFKDNKPVLIAESYANASAHHELDAVKVFQQYINDMRAKYGENTIPRDWPKETIPEFERLRDISSNIMDDMRELKYQVGDHHGLVISTVENGHLVYDLDKILTDKASVERLTEAVKETVLQAKVNIMTEQGVIDRFKENNHLNLPLPLIEPVINAYTDKDGKNIQEKLNVFSVDEGNIMLYQSFTDAKNNYNPTMLADLPEGKQREIISDIVNSDASLANYDKRLAKEEDNIKDAMGVTTRYTFEQPVLLFTDPAIARDYVTAISKSEDNGLVLEGKRVDEAGVSASFTLEKGEYTLSDLQIVSESLKQLQQEQANPLLDKIPNIVSVNEANLISQYVMGQATGNYLLRDKQPEGYEKIAKEISQAHEDVMDMRPLTERQTGLLVTESLMYHGGVSEMAEELNVDKDYLSALLKASVTDNVKEKIQNDRQESNVSVLNSEQVVAKNPETNEEVTYTRIHGGTHDDPALIYSDTQYDVFFYDETKKTIENIDNPAGIDAYEDRQGYFLVRADEYEQAYADLEKHDREQGFSTISENDVRTLVSGEGLEYSALSLQQAVEAEGKSFSYAMVTNDNISLYERQYDAYDNRNETLMSELPEDKQQEILWAIHDRYSEPEKQVTVLIDSLQIPDYALPAIINGDYSGINDPKDTKNIEQFLNKDLYKGVIFSPREEEPSFHAVPAFGLPADTVTVDVLRISTIQELRDNEQIRRGINSGEMVVFDEHLARVKDALESIKQEGGLLTHELNGIFSDANRMNPSQVRDYFRQLFTAITEKNNDALKQEWNKLSELSGGSLRQAAWTIAYKMNDTQIHMITFDQILDNNKDVLERMKNNPVNHGETPSETVKFGGKEYPVRTLELSNSETVTVASTALLDALGGIEGIERNQTARALDEQIFYYVSPEQLNDKYENLVLTVEREALDMYGGEKQEQEKLFHIVIGEDDRPGRIEGEYHVRSDKSINNISFGEMKDMAEQVGGSVRITNNEEWADFHSRGDAEKYINRMMALYTERIQKPELAPLTERQWEIMAEAGYPFAPGNARENENPSIVDMVYWRIVAGIFKEEDAVRAFANTGTTIVEDPARTREILSFKNESLKMLDADMKPLVNKKELNDRIWNKLDSLLPENADKILLDKPFVITQAKDLAPGMSVEAKIVTRSISPDYDKDVFVAVDDYSRGINTFRMNTPDLLRLENVLNEKNYTLAVSHGKELKPVADTGQDIGNAVIHKGKAGSLLIRAEINGKEQPSKELSKDDAKAYRQGKSSLMALARKYFSLELKQEHKNGLKI